MLTLLTKLSALLSGRNAGSLDGGRVAAFVVPEEAGVYLVGLEVFHDEVRERYWVSSSRSRLRFSANSIRDS